MTRVAPSLGDVAEQLLNRASARVDQAEVYAYETTDTPVEFESNRLKLLEANAGRGLALRVIKGGRLGLASTTKLDDLDQVIDAAIELAAFGAEARFAFPEQIAPAAVDVFDAGTEALSVEQMVVSGQEMIDRVRSYNADILCDASVRRHIETTQLLNSRGGQGAFRATRLSLSISGQLIRDEDFLSIYEHDAACGPASAPAALAGALIEKFERAKQIASVSIGRFPVLFTPRGVASVLLPRFSTALSGRTVYQGSSALAEKRGEQVLDPRFSLIADSTISGVPRSSPFDDEGVPTRRLPLIDKGVVAGFYYDLQTAGLAGAASTGSGYRSLESLPAPSLGTILVEPGETPLDALLAGIEHGLLVESMTGDFAGNLYSGDFSGNVHTGFKIEHGQLAGRVKDTMVAGNVFSDMRHLAGISDTAEWVLGGVRAPHVLFSELGVSTKAAG